MGVGWYVYKKKGGLLLPSIGALVTLYGLVLIGNKIPFTMPAIAGIEPRVTWLPRLDR